MKNPEIQDYWRWKLVRQVSHFINDPGEENAELLLEMIESYPKIHQNLNSPGSRIRIEPVAADFMCTMEM
ncbi:MAG: hypothetical protein L0Y39_06135 [Methylococcaceae bacterium]|nr:hypothetical protein [Methylococcaceae bacterium]